MTTSNLEAVWWLLLLPVMVCTASVLRGRRLRRAERKRSAASADKEQELRGQITALQGEQRRWQEQERVLTGENAVLREEQQRREERGRLQTEELRRFAEWRVPEAAASGTGDRGLAYPALFDGSELAQTMDAVLDEVRELRAHLVEARGQAAVSAGRAGAALAELQHLARVRMPSLADHLAHERRPVAGLLHADLAGSEVDRCCQEVLDTATTTVRAAETRTDEAAQEVVRQVGSRLREQAKDMEKRLDRVQEQDLFGDRDAMSTLVFELDHAAVRLRRTADQAVVVCGGAPAQTREAYNVGDLLALVQAQVSYPDRVKLESHLPPGVELGVKATVTEPLAMIATALLDNAAFHHAGGMPVTAAVFRTGMGASIVIEDAGNGLDSVEKQEFARRMLSTDRRLRLTELGVKAQLGLATVQRLTRRYPEIRVTLGVSSSGGVKATVAVEQALLTDAVSPPVSASAPLPARSRPLPKAAAEPSGGTVSEFTGAGELPVPEGRLPRRQRRGPQRGTAPVREASAAASPDTMRARYAGYNDVVRPRGTVPPADDTHTHDYDSDEGTQQR
ncbi:ATP-binding protein [Streptomyces sp. JV176]|uniref:ATP-binding protein n=1 Tax=Streptomyces sp. JV176 TaxID=858630 RepID=UPI002E795429|nr:ATP-binding protein [Streptomyces sp. JV176]MEE1798111.1 ATP-binding protein [Streptomyces sp. JV176]